MIPMLRILAKRRAGASKPICHLFHLFYQVQIRLGCPRRGRRSGMIIPSPWRKASATNRSRCQLGPTHLLERCFAELLIRRTLTRAEEIAPKANAVAPLFSRCSCEMGNSLLQNAKFSETSTLLPPNLSLNSLCEVSQETVVCQYSNQFIAISLTRPRERFIYAAMPANSAKSPAVRFFTIHSFDDRPDIRAARMKTLLDHLTVGRIYPFIHDRLPLSEAARPRVSRKRPGQRQAAAETVKIDRSQGGG